MGTEVVDGIKDAQYYTAAANWAVEHRVIEGFERDGQAKRDFAPDEDLTFEQLIRVIANASEADWQTSDLSVLDGFADKDAVSDWAAHAMAWAVENGVVKGWDKGTDQARELKPGEKVSRERAAVALARAFKNGTIE